MSITNKDKNKRIDELFECNKCGGIFKKEWSDAEAKKEAEELFGKHPDNWRDRVVLVCDDCFIEIHPLKYPEIVERAKLKI